MPFLQGGLALEETEEDIAEALAFFEEDQVY